MKTTIEIADGLLADAKRCAASDGVSLRSIVETALRKELKGRERRRGYELPDLSQDLGGLRPEFEGATFADLLEESYRGRGT